MTQDTPNQFSQRNDRLTWLSFFAGAIIWFLHLNIVYPLTSLSCKWEWFPFDDAGMTSLRSIQIIITFVAALLIAILIYLPWRNWQHFRTDSQHVMSDTEKDRRPLMAFVTMGLNLFFLAFVVASLVPVLTLSPCN
jgi:fumarate reductase subunit D